MKAEKLIICTVGMGIALFMSVETAIAGHGALSGRNGKVSIECSSSSCVITTYNKSGKKLKSLYKAGGRNNFNKLMRSYKAKGYK